MAPHFYTKAKRSTCSSASCKKIRAGGVPASSGPSGY
jgi:hypothetical protein